MPLPATLCKAGAQEGEKPCIPQRHKPPVVPEPSTLVLISSGLATVYWRYRKTGHSVST
jgi:PEP-CTERM motif-containing protein